MSKEALDAAIRAANEQRSDGYSDEFKAALNKLAHLPRDDYLAVRPTLIAALPQIDAPIGAGLLAIWFGSEVENGIDPKDSAPSIVDAMMRWTRQIDTEGDPPDPHLAAGVQYLGQALVAHLARSKEVRAEAFARADFVAELERVEGLSVGAMWVSTLARQQSGSIVVLHGDTPVGVVVKYENLANCFHLFTLLQAALVSSMPGAKEVDDAVLEVATGQAYADVTDSAWWHFGSGDNTLGGSIWGEAALDSLPQHDGQQYLVLWPPLLGGRSWGAGFFGPFLQASPPSVEVERTLTIEEVGQWREAVIGSAD